MNQSSVNVYRMRAGLIAMLMGVMLAVGFSAKAATPNLLIISTDEHNFRTLGCYRDLMEGEQALMWGDAVVETPHIDWIADQGAICTSYYATTPVCSPSRGSLVSGRYPQHTPVTTNNISLSDDIVTFAEVLKRKGYATGYAGKWHLDGGGKPQWAPERKFGFDDNRFMFNRGHWKKLIDTTGGPAVGALDKKGEPGYAVDGADEITFATDWLSNKTIDFLNANKGKAFCYMLSLPDPHGPDTVRVPYDTMYAGQTYTQPSSALMADEDIPAWGEKQGGNFEMDKYYGMVKCIDDNIGRIIGALRKNGQLENTVLVFTSDHGDLRGEHHRHNKGVPWEASARIPFLMYYAGVVKAGTVIDQALGTVDFMPTVLSLMGVKGSGAEEGRDASQLFKGDNKGWEDVAFVRSTGNNAEAATGWLMAVSDRYKLIFASNEMPILYDLQENPNETVNYLEKNKKTRGVAKKLTKALVAYAREQGDPYVTHPRIAGDIKWVLNGEGAYVAPVVKAAAQKRGKKK